MSACLFIFVSSLFVICSYGRSDVFESKKEIDSFYDDETASNWIIYSGNVKDEFAASWNNDEKWDFINEDMQTNKGHIITRKCENVFGSLLCLCQFKKLVGKSHDCYAQNQIQTQKQSKSFKKTDNAMSDPSNYIKYDKEKLEKEIIAHKEKKIEKEIAAAQIEAENDELTDDEIDDLEDEVIDLMDEENDAFADEDEDLESDNDINIDIENKDIDALGEEIGSQNKLIKEQNELIEELREDNAMKMELIDILEEDDDDNDDDDDAVAGAYEEKDESDDSDIDSDVEVVSSAKEKAVEVEAPKVAAAKKEESVLDVAYDYDDDMEVNNDDDEESENVSVNDLVKIEENERYYDDDHHIDEAMQDYHFIYEEDNDKEDVEREEAEALIEDAVWGLEIYSVAFGVLCCLCVCCWAQKTKCCGLIKRSSKNDEYSYEAYHSQHNFGNCEEEELQNDIEMGVDIDRQEVAYINGGGN